MYSTVQIRTGEPTNRNWEITFTMSTLQVARPTVPLAVLGTKERPIDVDDDMCSEMEMNHVDVMLGVQEKSEATEASNTCPLETSASTSRKETFKSGDHVYVWCHARVYQHHGIVLQTEPGGNLIIADFTNLGGGNVDKNTRSSFVTSQVPESRAASRSSSGLPGGFRFLQEDPSKWHKVKYKANPWEAATWRPGTCSRRTADPVDQILARVHFLMMHHHLVPPYELFSSNCETVAVWCTTGQWRTLQISHLLNLSKTTSVLGTGGLCVGAAAGSTASTAGAIGTELSLLAANPLMAVLCSAAIGGAALWNALRIRNQWNETSSRLTAEFNHFWTEPQVGVKLVRLIEHEDDPERSVQS